MSSGSSKTGLLASPTKNLYKKIKKKQLHLKAQSSPAPVTLRPYAGLYNPYPYGCSLLCNHPTDKEAKDVLKRARESWATENKNIISQIEIQAIRQSLAQVEESNKPPPQIESIPEELFRRYTETDSRPLTPAPTIASVKTRGSSSRRCVTPDAMTTSVMRERTLLILDLRRSHSQEIFSWHGMNDPPMVNILQAPTPSGSIESALESPDLRKRKDTAKSQKQSPKSSPKQVQKLEIPKIQPPQYKVPQPDPDQSDDEEGIIKRKGKRRKKRGRDSSRGPLAVQASIDPETQVGALDSENINSNTRLSLTPGNGQQDGSSASNLSASQQKQRDAGVDYSLAKKSILELNILKHLQRELNAEVLDLEFDNIKKAVLEEAYRTLPTEKRPPCEEIISLKKELDLPPINEELWLSLPRVFSRRSIRFELPIHSRILNTLKPIEYLQEYVFINSGRRLLYNLIFNRNKICTDESNTRILCNENIQLALGEMMGRPLSNEQMQKFQELTDWKDNIVIDFKTWCGICALFERVFAKDFCPQLPGKDADPCNEIEIADFQTLSRRLDQVNSNECLLKMLAAIQEL